MSLPIWNIGFMTVASILVCPDPWWVLKLFVILNLYAPILNSRIIKISMGEGSFSIVSITVGVPLIGSLTRRHVSRWSMERLAVGCFHQTRQPLVIEVTRCSKKFEVIKKLCRSLEPFCSSSVFSSLLSAN